MTRQLRIEFPGAFYHITARGNKKENIFMEDGDKDKLLGYFDELHRRYEIIIYTYCLMNNHYHLLIQTPQGNISKVMHDLNSRHTLYLNKRYERTGHLFQGRYNGILVDADSYLLTVSRYIHLNPVRAKIVQYPEDYQYSSIAYYLTEKEAPAWLNTELILKQFSQNIPEAREYYRRFLYKGIKDNQNPFKDVYAQVILGKPEFVEKIRSAIMDIKPPVPGVTGRKEINYKKELKDIEEQVYCYYNIEKKDLLCPRNGSKAIKVFVYLAREYTNTSLKSLGNYLGGRLTNTAISKIATRVKADLKQNKQLQEDIYRLEQLLKLSK